MRPLNHRFAEDSKRFLVEWNLLQRVRARNCGYWNVVTKKPDRYTRERQRSLGIVVLLEFFPTNIRLYSAFRRCSLLLNISGWSNVFMVPMGHSVGGSGFSDNSGRPIPTIAHSAHQMAAPRQCHSLFGNVLKYLTVFFVLRRDNISHHYMYSPLPVSKSSFHNYASKQKLRHSGYHRKFVMSEFIQEWGLWMHINLSIGPVSFCRILKLLSKTKICRYSLWNTFYFLLIFFNELQVRWLAFRLMLASGIVKLTSNCPTWYVLQTS